MSLNIFFLCMKIPFLFECTKLIVDLMVLRSVLNLGYITNQEEEYLEVESTLFLQSRYDYLASNKTVRGRFASEK